MLSSWIRNWLKQLYPSRSRRRPIRSPRCHGKTPLLEVLEDRTLPSVTLSGVPEWAERGPGPINNLDSVLAPPNNAASGAVQSIAVNPNDPTNIVVGTVNGGVWSTANADPSNPGAVAWQPLTDQLGSLAIGAVAFSPMGPPGQTIFAGTGDFTSFAFNGGPAVGLYRTTDGGATWSLLGPNLAGHRIKQVLPTAVGGDPAHQVILVATVDGGGLFRSADGGQTFTAVPLLPPPGSPPSAFPLSQSVTQLI